MDGELFSRHFLGVPGHRWLAALAGWLAGWLAALAGKPLEVGVVCLQIQKSFLRSLNKISSKKF